MATTKVPTFLRRYTDLPALLHLLSTRKITLLDPKTWDDKNDSYFMSVYKEKKKLKSVLALCFSQSPETYHHWNVFSKGPSGVCIVFDRQGLLDDFKGEPGISTKKVEYLSLPKAKAKVFQVDELPFQKRYGYKPENEFRALYTSTSKTEVLALDVPIRLASIRSVSLSPWMHLSLARSVMASIRSIDGCARLKVSRSTLISNEDWKRYGLGAI